MCPFDDDNDLRALKPRAIALWHTHQSVIAERDTLAARVKELEHTVAKQSKALFGKSSERGTPATDSTASPAPPVDVAAPSAPAVEPAPRVYTGHGRRKQPKLCTVPVVHSLSADDKQCTSCGGTMEEWPGQFETSQEIDVERREFIVREHKRQKYRCRCGGCIRTAKPPLKLKEGNAYSVAFGVHVAAAKYDQHQPLERQARVMGAEGLKVDGQTLWDQVDSVAFWCGGAYRTIRDQVLKAPVVGADETQWLLMDTKKNAPVPTSKWWIWLVRSPEAVVYHFDAARTSDAGATLLKEYTGVVMCDGYAVYKSLAKTYKTITIANCWSHIRRDFFELGPNASQASKDMLKLINDLFRVDRVASAKGETLIKEATSEEDKASTRAQAAAILRSAREEQSRAILGQIADKALEIGLANESASAALKACATMSRQWEGLILFVHNEQIPLHNNATEQSGRSPVLGRRTHQGSRSERGTEVAAILYTMCESAKLAGVDPEYYLLLSVRRALMRKAPVTPSAVTKAMLIEDCGLQPEQAEAALSR